MLKREWRGGAGIEVQNENMSGGYLMANYTTTQFLHDKDKEIPVPF